MIPAGTKIKCVRGLPPLLVGEFYTLAEDYHSYNEYVSLVSEAKLGSITSWLSNRFVLVDKKLAFNDILNPQLIETEILLREAAERT